MNNRKYIFVFFLCIAIGLGLYAHKGGLFEKSPEEAIHLEAAPLVPKHAERLNAISVEERKAMMIEMSKSALSTDAERQEYFELANSLSVVSGSLDIYRCIATPFVFKAPQSATFLIKNSGPRTLELIFDGGALEFESGQTREVSLGKGVGIYGYGCNESGEPVGFVMIDP